MAKELGIGVRVWVGWVSDDQTVGIYDGRCKTGTIYDGPFRKGDIVQDNFTGSIMLLAETFWNVDLDGGGKISAAEDTLFPIDDDSNAVRDTQKKPEIIDAT